MKDKTIFQVMKKEPERWWTIKDLQVATGKGSTSSLYHQMVAYLHFFEISAEPTEDMHFARNKYKIKPAALKELQEQVQ